jgi:hypothetical protein
LVKYLVINLKRVQEENMSIKKLVSLICTLVAISFHTGCSSKKENEVPLGNVHEIYEKVAKDRENRAARSGHYSKEEETKREKQIAVADACLEQFNSCLEKCKNSSCDDLCLKALLGCEKELPLDLKTIKEK